MMGHGDDPVDLRRFAVGTTRADLVHEDFDLAIEEKVTSGLGDGVLELPWLGETVVAEARFDLPVEGRRVRAVLG